MTFNAGLLNTSLATDVIGNTKLDLATPVSIYTSLQANKRANQASLAQQKLSDLTLSENEKAQKKAAQRQQILQSSLNPDGTINAEKAITGLNKIGDFDAANGIQDRMFKVAEERKKAQDMQVLELGKIASAVLDAPNPVEAFANFKIDAEKRGLKLSKGLLNYMPVAEELADGRIDPNVKTELQYYLDRTLTPEQKLEREKTKAGDLTGEEKFFGNLIPAKDENGNMALFSTSNQGKAKQVQFPAGFKLDPKLVYKDANDKIVILDGTKEIGSIDKGVSKSDAASLALKQKEEARKQEEFEQNKIKTARESRSYEQKNKGQIDSIQTFLDKAVELKTNPDLKYTSGLSRFNPTKGSQIPVISTPGKDVQAAIDYLVSAGVVETMAKLKAESPTGSTGFGALSEKEMDVLKNSFSILGNKDISIDLKVKEIDRVIGIMDKRLREQRSFSRESNQILGPEKTADQKLDEGIDEL
jgi:hypothetical protein